MVERRYRLNDDLALSQNPFLSLSASLLSSRSRWYAGRSRMRSRARLMSSARVAAVPAMISVSSVSRPAGPSRVSSRVVSPCSRSWMSDSRSPTRLLTRGPWPSRVTGFGWLKVYSTGLISGCLS
jgi:hypothetical protein